MAWCSCVKGDQDIDTPPDQRSGVVYFCADCGAKLDGLGIGHGADCLVPLIRHLRAENERLREAIHQHAETIDAAGPIRVADDESEARAIRKNAADQRLWRLVENAAVEIDEERAQ